MMPAVVTLPGEIDITNAGNAETQITTALAPGVTIVIADLTKTTFCDSTGLQHLFRADQAAARSGAELRLVVSPGGTVARVLELTGLRRRFAVYPTLEQAAGQPPSG